MICPSGMSRGEAAERISASVEKWSSLAGVLQVLLVKGLVSQTKTHVSVLLTRPQYSSAAGKERCG